MEALITTIKREGQQFVYEPVYAKPKAVSAIEASVAYAFERQLPQPILVRHERVRLRWMKPDGKGRLKPR